MSVPAVLVQVAEAVRDALNEHTFSQKFTARRTYPTWKVPLEKQSVLLVDVVPTSHPRSELETQGSMGWDCRCVVVIRRKFGDSERKPETTEGRPLSNDPVDALILLVEEICKFLYDPDEWRLTNSHSIDAAIDNDGVKVLTTYNDEHLANNNQFTAAIQVTYGVSQDT